VVDRAHYERLIAVLRAHDIRYFLYNGGNDSADTSLKITQIAQALNYPLHVIGVPKTVDNDLPLTDSCPGFGSVAKYTAVSVLEASLDVAAMCESSTKVFVMEVMGRHAGWIAAAAGLAGKRADDPPHIILFPEVPFDEAKFLARVKATVERVGYCTVVVSEGLNNAEGKFLAEAGTSDAFGHTQLGGVGPLIAQIVKARLGYKFHWAVPDYLQRSARHLASKVDAEQAYAVGKTAVEYALAGDSGVMPIIQRTSSTPFKWKIVKAPIDKIANIEKKLPPNFITPDGFGITSNARRYFEPLIRGEDAPPYDKVSGLPKYTVLKRKLLKKKLPAYPLADK
jgi:6-phosphofructokinase 1